MRRGKAASGAVALLALLAFGCRGPRPEVETVELRAGGPGTLVHVVVANRSDGEGQVEVEVTLRSAGRVVAREERLAVLYPRERVTLTVPVPTPYRSDLAAEVRARYPVD